LPDPRELGGFRWKPYERARKKLDDIEGRRRDAQRRAAELKRSRGGRGMSEYDPALDEDFSPEEIAALEAVLDGSTSRKHGEDVLAVVEAANQADRGPHPLLAALDQAHRARLRNLDQEGGLE
jgi:hypothetical protein